MKITKNVTITEDYGFVVRNNGIEVGCYNNIQDAEKKAFEIAKEEHKGIRYNTDFYNTTIKAEEVAKR